MPKVVAPVRPFSSSQSALAGPFLTQPSFYVSAHVKQVCIIPNTGPADIPLRQSRVSWQAQLQAWVSLRLKAMTTAWAARQYACLMQQTNSRPVGQIPLPLPLLVVCSLRTVPFIKLDVCRDACLGMVPCWLACSRDQSNVLQTESCDTTSAPVTWDIAKLPSSACAS